MVTDRRSRPCVVALVIAAWSAYLAKRAADAAAESNTATSALAATAAEELAMLKAEAARRPVLAIESISQYAGPVPHSVVLAVGLSNSGDADATNSTINLLLPTGTIVAKCPNETGTGARMMNLIGTTEQLPAPSGPARYAIEQATLLRGIGTVAFYRFEFPAAGS